MDITATPLSRPVLVEILMPCGHVFRLHVPRDIPASRLGVDGQHCTQCTPTPATLPGGWVET